MDSTNLSSGMKIRLMQIGMYKGHDMRWSSVQDRYTLGCPTTEAELLAI